MASRVQHVGAAPSPLGAHGPLVRAIARFAASHTWRVAAPALASAVLVALGVLGVGHGGPAGANLDVPFFYLAGRHWLGGDDAYAPTTTLALDGALGEAVARYDFAYPPQIAPLCLLLALGSPAAGNATMTLVNLAAAVALAHLAVRLTEAGGASAGSRSHRWFVPALVLGNCSTAFVVWTGQTSLIVAAALAGAWDYERRGRYAAAGVLAAVASIKPPLSMFVLLWFGLERRWRTLAAAGAAVLVFAAVPVLVAGPLRVYGGWLAAMDRYGGHPENALGSRMVVGLPSLLHALGVTAPNLVALGVLATVGLWLVRRRFAEDDLLGVLVSFGLLFGFGHSYDLAALVLLVPAYWRRLHTRPAAALVALAMLVAISFPNSRLEPLGSPVLLHARVALVAAATAWLLWESARHRSSHPVVVRRGV